MDKSAILLRIRIEKKIVPQEAPRIQKIVTRIIPRSTLRVVRDYAEIVTFTKPSIAQLEALKQSLDATSIEVLEPPNQLQVNVCPAKLYIELIEENRFWEAHIVGEEIWRRKGSIGRCLAALAGAYAKAQEGLLNASRAILERALGCKELRRIVKIKCLEKELERIYHNGVGEITRCIDTNRLIILLCNSAKGKEE